MKCLFIHLNFLLIVIWFDVNNIYFASLPSFSLTVLLRRFIPLFPYLQAFQISSTSQTASPLFPNVEVFALIQLPPALEFSHNKNILRHFGQNLKPPPKNQQQKNTLFYRHSSQTYFISSRHVKTSCLTKKVLTFVRPLKPKLKSTR